jgi:hypothetical protein
MLPEGKGMNERDDVAKVGRPALVPRRAPEWGGEPRRNFRQTSLTMSRSDLREFVARDSVGGRYVPLGRNLAGLPGGAVPLQLARPSGAKGAFSHAAAFAVQILCCERFSRLSVLMNPILPGAGSIRTWPAK